MTLVHIPSKNSSELRAGISSINLLEEVACGIPVITKSWINTEGMLTPGRDYLQAADSYEMKHYILEMMNSTLKEVISDQGVKTIAAKHTCKHRSKELNIILQKLIESSGKVLLNN